MTMKQRAVNQLAMIQLGGGQGYAKKQSPNDPA